MPLHVSGSTSDGLDQGCLRPQKAFLIRIQDGYEGYLRDIQTLTEEIDPNQHIEDTQAEVSHNL